MIEYIERLLRRIGVLPPFDKDDVLNALIDDKKRDTRIVMEKLEGSFARRHETNAYLRESIKIAKHRTNSFADFERLARGHREDRN